MTFKTINLKEFFFSSDIKENKALRLFLAAALSLGTSATVYSGLSLGLALLAVLAAANAFLALLGKMIPKDAAGLAYGLMVVGFSMMATMLAEAFLPVASEALGMFLPFVCINAFILGRKKQGLKREAMGQALEMGTGFAAILFAVASLRELAGSGAWFGISITDGPISVFSVVPGAFFSLALVIAAIRKAAAAKGKEMDLLLGKSLGSPLILAMALLVYSYGFDFLSSAASALWTLAGAALLCFVLSGVNDRLEAAPIPKSFKGLPITLITTGFAAIALVGLSGII